MPTPNVTEQAQPTLESALAVVTAALGKLAIRRTANGEVELTAPADIAPTLGVLFTTLGNALTATARS